MEADELSAAALVVVVGTGFGVVVFTVVVLVVFAVVEVVVFTVVVFAVVVGGVVVVSTSKHNTSVRLQYHQIYRAKMIIYLLIVVVLPLVVDR